jgi:3-hydroxy-9,10-secoandrosta-1,3,5(10)-triene-9,17-dione monooxygenase reductase component
MANEDATPRAAVEPAREPAATALDGSRYREAIAHFATGVTVVTTRRDGEPVGMTASAVASLSLDPILLLVCISNRLPTHEAIEQSRAFVVNVLGEGQGDLARHFATPAPDKFAAVPLREGPELPVLAKGIAHFVCDVHERFPGGDHSIFIGLVRECDFIPGRRPLLYYRSAFGALHDPQAEATRDALGWDMPSLSGIGPLQGTPKK